MYRVTLICSVLSLFLVACGGGGGGGGALDSGAPEASPSVMPTTGGNGDSHDYSASA